MDLRTDPATITNLGENDKKQASLSNNLDLAEKKTKKPISKTQGEKLAADLGAEMYVECSALTGEGMKNVFDEVTMTMARMMMRKLVMVMIIAFKQSFMKYWGNQWAKTIFPKTYLCISRL